jgi:hypothetical protein
MSPVFTGLGHWTSRLAAVAIFAISLLPVTAGAFPSSPGERVYAVPAVPLVAADWQGPLSLPPRFRNHCRYDPVHGGWYCANHCGPDYQFYFCSPESFGCCRPGYGYCDWKGHLRCAP